MKKALVIGCGSIGLRHAAWLTDLGCPVSVVSKRKPLPYPVYPTIEAACEAEQYDYAVISTPTADHAASLGLLNKCGFHGTLLVEKPIFHTSTTFPKHNFRSVYVAYNLRFHPIIEQLYELLQNEEDILSFHVYAGQYLPEWRPKQDYRLSYSASKAMGGGVLRDLSHELDYVNWMLGNWKSVTATGGRYSRLGIDSEDVYGILLETRRCPVAVIQLNYLDRKSRREIIVNTGKSTMKADLIANTLEIDRKSCSFAMEKDYTYRAMHRSLLKEEHGKCCTSEEGLEVLRLIEAVEYSAGKKVWVQR